jgi:4'-phosphopantetheinyl transferase EntD
MGRIDALVPTGIVACESTQAVPIETLLPEERAVVAHAVRGRAAEFAAGRWCARTALSRLGIPECPLLPGAGRAPAWPDGIVGSITHTAGFCAAAVGRRHEYAGIGIDAEALTRVVPELWSHLFLPDEIDALRRLPARQRECTAAVFFSAKESFYKAQYAITGAWLGFKDALVDVNGDTWALRIVRPVSVLSHIREPFIGRYELRETYVFTAIAIRAIAG